MATGPPRKKRSALTEPKPLSSSATKSDEREDPLPETPISPVPPAVEEEVAPEPLATLPAEKAPPLSPVADAPVPPQQSHPPTSPNTLLRIIRQPTFPVAPRSGNAACRAR